ncbi:hypothetical protein V6N12_000824 [Hibiscus sabdariffa]|uniref:Reverse transcriptase zinc-binding domain-containing protein n=1 Tax=Hibiscus sabdariffa TaxID=183260 RepID=A0ABR2BXH7_9ROSI
MACRDDMMRVVAKLDKSIIDGKHIIVSKERFPRDRVGGVSSLRKAQSSDLTKSVHWQPAIKKNVGVALDKSVVNVKVLNDGDNFTSLNIPVEKNAWLKCCLVGILKNLFEVGFVQQAFLHEGIDARLVRWGVEQAPLLINDIPHQFCYVNLAGVPLTCWHSDFFSTVGKQWGSFVDIEENTRTRARLDVACVILRVASLLTIPDFLMVEALGFKFKIDISLGFKEVVDSVPGNGEVEENFADVWPENHFEQDLVGEQIGVEVQNNCSSHGVGLVAEFSRNNTFHIPTMNGIDGDTLTKNLASPRIVYNNDSIIGSGLHDKLVQEKENLMFVPVSSVGLTGQALGLSSPILVDSVPIYNNPIILGADRPGLGSGSTPISSIKIRDEWGAGNFENFPTSPSICSSKVNSDCAEEFVPDSLDGVDSFVGGVNIEVVGSRFQCNSGSSAPLPQQGLFKACIRRRVRRHVRDSLEGIQSLGGKSFIPLSSDKNFTAEELEAEAVWDISNLLDIAFKGGKEAVKWSGNSFRDSGKSIALLEKEISVLESRIQSEGNVQDLLTRLGELRAGLWMEFRREESSWLQKSRLRSESALLSVPGCGRNTSWIWKGILKSACCEDSFGLCFRVNLSVQVGDGKHILFWDDVWLGNSSLKDQFPRFYALSCNKSGKVADFGRKIGARWVWHIPLRRGLFDRELPYWQEFMSRLNTFQSSVSGHDWVRWLGSSDGSFSVKSLKKLVIGPLPPSNFWDDFVWIGFAPPKVELFVWLVMLERISVKVELVKRGVVLSGSSLCVFCQEFPESTDHLLFTCHFSWKLWMSFCAGLGLSSVWPKNPKLFMEAWRDLCSSSFSMVWSFIPFAVIWTLWLFRNEIVFNSKCLDWLQLVFCSKFRLGSWVKAKFGECSLSLDCIVNNPFVVTNLCLLPRPLASAQSWSPPPHGFAKLNVDGALSSSREAGGLGGLLRDENGRILFQFLESCGSGPPALIELQAAKLGMDLFLRSE